MSSTKKYKFSRIISCITFVLITSIFALPSSALAFGGPWHILSEVSFVGLEFPQALSVKVSTKETVKKFSFSQIANVFYTLNNLIDQKIYTPITELIVENNIPKTEIKITNKIPQKTIAVSTSTSVSKKINTKNQIIKAEVPILIKPTAPVISQSLSGFITYADLQKEISTKLNDLENKISTKFYGLSSGSGGAVTNIYQQIANTQRIDQLTNTHITNPTISGGSFSNIGITGSSFSGTTGTFTDLSTTNLSTTNFNSSSSTFSGVTVFSSNVGIGTTSPSDSLAVNGAVYLAQISAPSVTTNRLYNSSGSLYWAGNLIGGAATGVWSSDGTHVWRAGGNVGIGTTSPSSKLSVKGGGTTTGRAFAISDSSDVEKVTVLDNGNVGIGTTGPLGPLHVTSTSAAGVSTAYPQGNIAIFESEHSGTAGNSYGIQVGKYGTYAMYLGINKNTASGQIPANAAYIGTYSSVYPMVFGRNYGQAAGGATADLTISTDGNVGIGNTAPRALLDIGKDVVAAAASLTAINGQATIGRTGSTGYGALEIGANGANYGWLQYADTNTSGRTVYPLVLNPLGGNVGIGTTSPWRKLSVSGNAAFSGLTNDSTGYYVCLNSTTYDLSTSTTACGASSLRFKQNIETLSDNRGIESVMAMRPVTFDYKPETNVAGHQIGFIAEEMFNIIPEAVGVDSGGVPTNIDYSKLTPVLTKAIQQLSAKFDQFKESLVAWFADASNGIGDFFANRIRTKELCVADNSGETCITKSQLDALILNSSSGGSHGGSGSGNATTTDTSVPVITINGNNPAEVLVGSSYSDMGAIVIDTNADGSVNNNLGLHFNVDGTDMVEVSLDTSTTTNSQATTTHTIIYSAEDGAGNWGYATRTVYVLQ